LIFNLRVVGGALKEIVHTYAKFSPNVEVKGAKTGKRRRVVFAVATRR
jgi:hypothetical protein